MMKIQLKSRPIVYFLSGCVLILISLAVISYTTGKGNFENATNAIRINNIFKTSKPGRNFSISEMMGSANTIEVVKPNETTILFQPSMPFVKKSAQRPFALVLVTSLARYFKQRQAIRSTWYKWADNLDIRIFFTIGFQEFTNLDLFQILQEEQSLYNDLIVDNYEEGYYRLPGKMLRMLKWYNATYSDINTPRFVIKTDHDVFLNLPNIVNALKRTAYYKNLVSLSNGNSSVLLRDEVNLPFDPTDPETYYVGGRRFENSPIESDPGSKWYIDEAEREILSWPLDFFPTYTNGPCYVMSGNVIKSVYEASFSVPIYPFEDVYLVGMIAFDQLDLFISNLEGMWLDRSNFCLIKVRSKFKKMLALHPVDSPFFMIRLCRKISSCKRNLELSASTVALASDYLSFALVLLTYILKKVCW